MANRAEQAAEAIAALENPTPNEIFKATKEFDTRSVASAAATLPEAGNGGSQPDPLRTPVNIQDASDNFVAAIADGGTFFQVAPGNEANLVVDIAAITGQTGALLELDGVNGETLIFDAHAKMHADPGITDLPTPTDPDDAATKQYVDDATQLGLPEVLSNDASADNRPIAELSSLTVTESGGTPVVFSVNQADLGTALLKFHINTEPADGLLLAGECAFWFDSTNGAAKFKVKAKQANGDTVQGEIALS